MQIAEIVLLVIIIAILLLKNRPTVIRPVNTSRKVILDTCALIDGRIIELSLSGFVPDQLIVPEFILHELQLLADGTDSHKRERARFGLDIVKELQSSPNSSLIIDTTVIDASLPTDDKLVELAKKLNAPLYTTDYNLNKVADIKGVKVLNVNELAQQLKPAVLPGEKVTVKLLQRGSSQRQTVGYLDDGTMVVVGNSDRMMGKTVEVEIVRSLQTVAGKMIFAELTGVNQAPRRHHKDHKPRS
jgi:uncharacterized protein YacL